MLFSNVETLRGPISSSTLQELGARNQERVSAKIREMGPNWLGHKDNRIKIVPKSERSAHPYYSEG